MFNSLVNKDVLIFYLKSLLFAVRIKAESHYNLFVDQ